MLVSQESHQEIWACFGWEMEWRPWGSKAEAESRAGGEFAELTSAVPSAFGGLSAVLVVKQTEVLEYFAVFSWLVFKSRM